MSLDSRNSLHIIEKHIFGKEVLTQDFTTGAKKESALIWEVTQDNCDLAALYSLFFAFYSRGLAYSHRFRDAGS